MTPTFRWVFLLAFLLALVGRAVSVPRPLVVDACALLCNPGAETESERERDPVLFPRYPKVNCKLQSESDEHQAWVIASHCMKLCNSELSIPSEVNCFALRSSLQANLGCYCEALTPLSPNTMRLHESWRLNFLVKELADDILNVILNSPLDTIILCEIHEELFKDQVQLRGGKLVQKCATKENYTTPAPEREVRDVHEQMRKEEKEEEEDDEEEDLTGQVHLPPVWEGSGLESSLDMHKAAELEETTVETVTEHDMEEPTDEDVLQMMQDKLLRHKLFSSMREPNFPRQDQEKPMSRDFVRDWKRVCKIMCKHESGNEFCQCKNPELGS